MSWGLSWRGWPLPTPVPPAPGPFSWWFKFSITHLALQAAALTNTAIIYAMPAGGVIHAAKLKHSIAFTGPAITDYYLSLGFAGETESLLIEYNVLTTAPGDQFFALSHCLDSRDHAAPANVLIAARSVGANLDQSRTGAADIWLYVSQAI